MELSLDTLGDLLVPDIDNHRVLLWSASALAHLASSACTRRCFAPATRVWGQYGSFATNTANNPAIPTGASTRCTPITYFTPASACTLSGPWAAISDAQGDLYVADTSNNRVLEYDRALSTGRQDATMIYGQGGSFVSATGNLGGISASSVWHPTGLSFDPAGNLWVADFRNMRVLEFSPAAGAPSAIAVGVLGQQGRFSSNSCGVRAWALCGPTSIAFDPAGHAFVSDGLNSRLLEFFAPGHQ
jgi:DNA-binding beta-propeller fold protein YncE